MTRMRISAFPSIKTWNQCPIMNLLLSISSVAYPKNAPPLSSMNPTHHSSTWIFYHAPMLVNLL